MTNFQNKADKIIRDFNSPQGVDRDELFNFCGDRQLLTNYMINNLINYESFEKLTQIITHSIPGRIKVANGVVLELFTENTSDGIVLKTRLIKI